LIAALVALAVFAARASIGGAATPAPSLTVMVSPQPAVTAGKDVLGVLKFKYEADASPTTITGVYVKVDIPAGSVFRPAPLSSSNCKLESGVVRCDLGNVSVGETRTMFVVASAPAAGFSMTGTAYWNENVNGSNPLPNNQVGPVTATTNVVTGTNVTVMGTCQTTVNAGSPLSLPAVSTTSLQTTQLSISDSAENFPCTPASAGVEASAVGFQCGSAACTTDTSFVFFPPLVTGAAAKVILDFPGSELPSGTTPKKFVLYEIVGNPPAGVVVADCGATTNASPDSCILSRAKFGTQGVELVLKVFGTAIDPRYIG